MFSPFAHRPRAVNLAPDAAPQRIHQEQAGALGNIANRGGIRDQAVTDFGQAWTDLIAHSHPDIETRVEVVERVPWPQEKLLQSKWLGWLAAPNYRRNSFTLQQYQSDMDRGREPKDRRAKRYVVARSMQGVVLPHVIRPDDRDRKKYPNARLPYDPEPKRRDALVLGYEGDSSWAGGLERRDRSGGRARAIAVGADIGVIGADARPVRRQHRSDRIQEGVMNFFGLDRRQSPNAAAQGRNVIMGNTEKVRDATVKLQALRQRAGSLALHNLGLVPPNAPLPATAPHPADRRRTREWYRWPNRWGGNARDLRPHQH